MTEKIYIQTKHYAKKRLSSVSSGLRSVTLELGLSGFKFGLPGGSDGKASVYNARDLGSIPGLGKSPEEGNGNLVQYSHLENPMDRGTWRATIHK